jgi:hypothetical protein
MSDTCLVAGFFMRGRIGGMSHRQKIRWHPYLMLGLGAVFLLLAALELCFYEPPGPSWLMRFASGVYGANHIGDGFAIFLFIGILFVALGVYGLIRRK